MTHISSSCSSSFSSVLPFSCFSFPFLFLFFSFLFFSFSSFSFSFLFFSLSFPFLFQYAFELTQPLYLDFMAELCGAFLIGLATRHEVSLLPFLYSYLFPFLTPPSPPFFFFSFLFFFFFFLFLFLFLFLLENNVRKNKCQSRICCWIVWVCVFFFCLAVLLFSYAHRVVK